jgi:hypothetical protein
MGFLGRHSRAIKAYYVWCLSPQPAPATALLGESGDGDGNELTAISSFDTDLPKLPF